MKKILIVPVLIVFSVGLLFGQTNTLLEIDNEKISVEEFKRIYFKNNRDSALTLSSLEEYLELFTNFKLKVHEAQKLELDKQKKFIDELATYRNQLVNPYLTDSATDEQLIRDSYERMKYIVRAQHMLFQLTPSGKPSDTVATYEKAHKALDEINAGADFTEMVKKYSEDPSAKYNNGDLGYFSAFKMVYEFEDAAFNLEPGEVSGLVRTQFGYHIIKVTDKRPAPGIVEAAHIMVRLPENAEPEQAEIAKNKIDEIYNKLNNGEDFAQLAKTSSEDPQTAVKGGALPEFTPGRMLPSFEEQIFSLETGQYSKPFRTRVGWHIVNKLGNKPVKSLKEERGEIKRKLSKTARADLSKQKVIERLKKEYNLQCNSSLKGEMFAAINHDSLLAMKWFVDKAFDENQELCSFAGQKINASDILSYIKKRVKQPKSDINKFLNEGLQAFIEKTIFDYEKAHLEEKYPDFAWLVKEYHDGILLFNITDSLVWQKAVADTTGLKEFYKENAEKYKWGERMKADIIELKPYHDLRAAQKLMAKTIKKKGIQEIKAVLIDKFNDSTIQITFDSGLWERGANRNVDVTNWKKGLHLADNTDNFAVFVYNHEIIPEQPKALSEVRGLVTADYQNLLEKQWIQMLQEKYKVVVHRELLNNLLSK